MNSKRRTVLPWGFGKRKAEHRGDQKGGWGLTLANRVGYKGVPMGGGLRCGGEQRGRFCGTEVSRKRVLGVQR